MDEMAVKLAEVDARSKSNTLRINKLEEEQSVMHSIATSVAVMANEQKNISTKVDDINCKVDKLESVPANRWNSLAEKIIWLAVGGALTYFASLLLK